MPAFSNHTFQSKNWNSTEQINELQHVIQENIHRLDEVKQKRLRIEEEISQCEVETVRRVDLMMGKGDVFDELVQLGHLLQEEKHLSEQLNGQGSAERKEKTDLQEMSECITNKARSLAAEIQEVKEHLAETKARNMAAQALIRAPTIKSKRHQSKPK